MWERFLHQMSLLAPSVPARALVAVSGGGDSVALLDLLQRGAPRHGLQLVVAHVDHGILPESRQVADRVEQLAREVGLPVLTGRLHLGPGTSETVARAERYRWLQQTLREEQARYIITAHHADDQAETVLLRLLRGSGPAGLAAMKGKQGNLLRPLLQFTRTEIAGYLAERNLPFWDDPANRDVRHLRSWIRQDVLPVIRARLPDVDRDLNRAAELASSDRGAWDQVIDLLPGLEWQPESSGASVAAAPFDGYDSQLACAVLLAVARRAGCLLSRERAAHAIELIRRKESGTRLEGGNGWTLEIVFGRARLTRQTGGPEAEETRPSVLLEGDAGDGELGRWRFYWRYEAAPTVQQRDALTAWFIPQALEARPWNPGDKVHPLGGRGRRLVVRCLQDARVPRSERKCWPMVTDPSGEIVWVPGVCRSNRLVPHPGMEALRVDAQVV